MNLRSAAPAALAAAVLLGCRPPSPAARSSYEDLVEFFRDWREFQRPGLVDGVPDYSAAAMTRQYSGLPAMRRRLEAIDTTGWSVAQRVDYELVEAELNGLEFDHRVLRPWERDPAFYVSLFPNRSDQPAREGHYAYGGVELWSYTFPLGGDDAAKLAGELRRIPRLLEQARRNLTGNARDLWLMGIRSFTRQSADLAALAERVSGDSALSAAVAEAREATDRFREWLEAQASSKTGASGVGIDNYNWYLRHVYLIPYSWEEVVLLMQRELARSLAALELEEARNRDLPPLRPVSGAAEWERSFNQAVTEYVGFLRSHRILTVKDYMDPALRARVGRFVPGPWEFFTEINYRDPIVMRTHDFHWIDLARMEAEPHESPIRRGPLLYNIFISRTEGFATAMEEMMMHAGFLDGRPRSRELIYILIAQRAARALGDLMMHANLWTLEEAARFTSSRTPRNWLRLEGNTVWGEQHLYLRQPGYGISYLIGKIEIERLLADEARRLGEGFELRSFVDRFTAAGLIPVSLIRWELTGERGGREAIRPAGLP
ncbi:hypothetical protein HRbin33_01734 [bacterium HR33]|nr:hypothetical protein HRbin33_01734 [bacterium HR33]